MVTLVLKVNFLFKVSLELKLEVLVIVTLELKRGPCLL